MFLRLIETLQSAARVAIVALMIAAFLRIVGAVDAGTMARWGRTHARLTNSAIGAVGGVWGAIPWQIIGGCLLLALLGIVVVLTWDHIKLVYLRSRSVTVRIID